MRTPPLACVEETKVSLPRRTRAADIALVARLPHNREHAGVTQHGESPHSPRNTTTGFKPSRNQVALLSISST